MVSWYQFGKRILRCLGLAMCNLRLYITHKSFKMVVKHIQFFGKSLELLTEEEQKAIKGGGRGRRHRRRRRREEERQAEEEELDPGCPPDYDE